MTRGQPAFVARCPAKINLGLSVLGRRDDGYHELDTVFQAIDLWDRLDVRPASGLSLRCDDPTMPTDESNLVLKAARMARDAWQVERGAAFELTKAIPVEAGLGGGSSDAAAALLLCARLWGMEPPRSSLVELGARLGADVPFFLFGGTAHGTGRGDHIRPLPPAPVGELLLGCPPFGLSTAEVFARARGKLTLPVNGVSVAPLVGHKWPRENDLELMANDLEEVVFEGWPELKTFRDALLEAGADVARLSGSGSTVYGIFGHAGQAELSARDLAGRFRSWGLLPTRAVDSGVEVSAPG